MSGKGTHICVVGAGESGVAAALLAQSRGFTVKVSDQGTLKPPYRAELIQAGIDFEEGKHTPEWILEASEIIKSPGIPDSAPLLQQASQNGIPIISEIEFAGRFTRAIKVCITGSNGKTTTTLLTAHILKEAGLDMACGGNLGTAMSRLILDRDPQVLVLEVSSFQLDGIKDFTPEIAVLLNITPDHLDRYGYSMDAYAGSKMRITMNQGPQHYFIYNQDDPIIMKKIKTQRPRSRSIPISLETKPLQDGVFVEDKELLIRFKHEQSQLSIQKLALQGRHNLYNTMASAVVARILEVKNDKIRECLETFVNAEHRLEDCGKIQGVRFINDSKATNVNSVWYALESMNSPVVWIAGGQDKGNDYTALEAVVREKVKALVCLGKDNSALFKAFEGKVPVIADTHSMTEAVKTAFHLAGKEDTVLLSPACASFDLFKNYEDRGRQFKAAVKEL